MAFDSGEKWLTKSAEQTEKYAVPTAEAVADLWRDKEELLAHMEEVSQESKIPKSERHYADPEPEAIGAREYRLSDIPTTADLAKLGELPFEVSITELDGDLILSTGTIDCASHSFVIDEKVQNLVEARHNRSKLSFHTHPGKHGERAHRPSVSDLLATVHEESYPDFLIGTDTRLVHFEFAEDVTTEELETLLEIRKKEREGREYEFIEDAEWQMLQIKLGNRFIITEYEYSDPDVQELIDECFISDEDEGE